jgi:hypothetical protein
VNHGLNNLRRGSVRIGWLLAAVVVVAGASWCAVQMVRRDEPVDDDATASAVPAPRGALSEAAAANIQTFCAGCHVFPPPASFPKGAWRKEVEKGFEFARKIYRDTGTMPPIEDAIQYFEERAPEQLDVPRSSRGTSERSSAAGQPLRFRKRSISVPGAIAYPGVSNVKWAFLGSAARPDCLVCDMRHGQVLVWRHDQPNLGLRPLAKTANPAHVEVVDLDGDGAKDLLVADLGSFLPTDDRVGRVVWLRRRTSGTEGYHPIVLASGLGRVADVQAADFDGDGDLDLVAAVFGYHTAGQVLYLENQTADYAEPKFRGETIEVRTGAIHVPIADLDGDGRPDFVTVFGQEHEQVVAYLNDGPGRFRRELIFAAPDPAYGSSGIQLVDFDGDGDRDVLYTNGDTLDAEHVKPYHSIQWLENTGGFPFRHHTIAALPGVHRAVAVDMDGDADLDIVACAFLPSTRFPEREELGLDSVIWLEQREAGRFVPHTLESVACDHATVDVGDFNRDGLPDLVTGNLTLDGASGPPELPPLAGWITIWENVTPRRAN